MTVFPVRNIVNIEPSFVSHVKITDIYTVYIYCPL